MTADEAMTVAMRHSGRNRACLLSLAVLTLGSASCDPVRDGYFYREVPPPIRLRSSVDVDATITLGAMRYRQSRRWFETGQSPGASLQGFNGPSKDVTIPVYLWNGLTLGLDGATDEEVESLGPGYYYPGPTVAFGSLTGVDDYLFVASTGDAQIQPVGAAGPLLSIVTGYQFLHRTCTADEPNHFQVVPFDTIVSYDPATASLQLAGRDPYLEGCGIQLTTPIDIGSVAAPLPPDPVKPKAALTVTDFAWNPTSDAVFLMAGSLAGRDVEILQVNVGELGAAQITFGDLYGPMHVATGGTSLLFNQAIFVEANDGSALRLARSYPLKQSLVAGDVSPQLKLPYSAAWPPGTVTGVLSPDGARLATSCEGSCSSGHTQIIDAAKAAISIGDLGFGIPRAWEPGGQALLISNEYNYSSLSLDGKITPLPSGPYQDTSVFFPEAESTALYFWTASGPQVLFQNRDGASVYNITSQQTTELVEPTRVAPPTAPVSVVVATDQVFAWALQCFGIGERSCNAELRRLSIATGVREVVASADHALQFSVSPDGTKIAFADDQNIYIKSIQP